MKFVLLRLSASDVLVVKDDGAERVVIGRGSDALNACQIAAEAMGFSLEFPPPGDYIAQSLLNNPVRVLTE